MRYALALLMVLAAACSHDTAAPAPNLTGTWAFNYNLTSAALLETCQSQGSLTITQSGQQLSGNGADTGVCQTPTGSLPFSETFTLTGTFVGTQVAITTNGGCSVTGTLQPGDKQIGGSMTCSSFAGTWQANR